jgi:membrane associated rhomboid family serine protease
VTQTDTRQFPRLTTSAVAVCMLIFVNILLAGKQQEQAVEHLGYVPAFDLWSGKWWGLVTSVFVHEQPMHLLMNLYWVWHLGGAMERTLGELKWLAFLVTSAVVSSAAQLYFGGTGIGFSGVVYAWFGFAWVARRHYPLLDDLLDEQTVKLFFIWLAACFFFDWLGLMAIGNGAHLGGFLFGAGVGAVAVRRWPLQWTVPGLAAVVLLCLLPLFWCPWSASWASAQAASAWNRQDFAAAERWSRAVIRLDGDRAWAWGILAGVYHETGREADYRKALAEMAKLDAEAGREAAEEQPSNGEAGKEGLPPKSGDRH